MRMRRFAALCSAGAMALLLSACGGGQYRPVRDVPVKIGPPYTVRGVTYTPAADPGYDMLGYASWYGSESGNRTANGERFRPGWVSAAHVSLPLPSYVEVTALDTGRTIVVRVNDRGPFNERRIIDLSYAAAVRLDMVDEGEAEVEVVALTPGSDTGGDAAAVIANAAPPPPRYFESERYDDPVTAIAYREALTAAGVTSVEIRVSHEMGAWHRLRIGPLANAVAAEAAENQLRALGIVYRPVD